MFKFIIFIFIFAQLARGQDKVEVMKQIQKVVYGGCTSALEAQERVSIKEMMDLAVSVKKILNETYARGFGENPRLNDEFQKDLNQLARDSKCQKDGNNCRVELFSMAYFYTHKMRADLPECKYISKDKVSQCEWEQKYRKESLQHITGTRYGKYGPGRYKNRLIEIKNSTTQKVFETIFRKDKFNLHICNPTPGEIVYNYNLDTYEVGEPYSNMKSDQDSPGNFPVECLENSKIVLNEFINTPIDERRFTVGEDQVRPIRERVNKFLIFNPKINVTNITITLSMANLPHYKIANGKKVLDENSKEKNNSLLKDQMHFLEKIFQVDKNRKSAYSIINYEFKSELAGPEFNPLTLNERFVTPMTPGYEEKIKKLYKAYEKDYKEKALLSSDSELLNKESFENVFHAKYKPFQGYRITIEGMSKDDINCSGFIPDKKKEAASGTKQ